MNLGKKLNGEYSVIQGTYWMIYGAIGSFASVFLLSKGYSNWEIGVILAAANVLSVVIQPVVADFADRARKISLIGLLQIMTVLMMIMTFGLFVFEKKTLALGVIFVLLSAWHTTLQPLISSLCFKLEETGHKVSFGVGRSAGSFFYAVLMAFLGKLVESRGEGVLPVTAELVMAMLFISLILVQRHYSQGKEQRALGISPDAPDDALPNNDAAASDAAAGGATTSADASAAAAGGMAAAANRNDAPDNALPNSDADASDAAASAAEINLLQFIRRNRMFFILNLGVLGIYFSNAVLNYYTMQIVANVGGNSEDLGGVMAVMAFLEIPPMLFFGSLRKRFSCQSMLKFAGIMFTVKIGIISMARSVTLIYVGQLLQPFSFALFLPAMVNFIDEIMSPGEAVKGQALYTMMITVTSVVASIAGGVVLDVYGPKTLTTAATIITLLGALIVVGCVGKVGQKK